MRNRGAGTNPASMTVLGADGIEVYLLVARDKWTPRAIVRVSF